MKKIIYTITWTLLMLSASSCSSGNGTDIDPVINTGKERFTVRYNTNQTFYSATLKEEIKYNVLLPAEYLVDTVSNYNVVYLLHGYGDDQSAWGSSLNIQLISDEQQKTSNIQPMIYVMPQGFNSYYCNAYDGSFNYMNMLINELVPLIDKRFRTNATNTARAVAGYSMGGFGALTLAMQHPEVFSVSLGLSPSMNTDVQYASLSQDGFNLQWGAIFGGKGTMGTGRITSYYKSQCPLHIIADKAASSFSTVRFYIDCGDDEERLYAGNGELHSLMRDKSIAHEYRVRNGAHTTGYWIQSMAEGLRYIDKSFRGSAYTDESLQQLSAPSHYTKSTISSAGGDIELYLPKNYDSKNKYSIIYYSHGSGGADMSGSRVAESLDSLMGIKNVAIACFDATTMKNDDARLSEIIKSVEGVVPTSGTSDTRLGLAYGANAGFMYKAASGQAALLKYLFLEDASVSELSDSNTASYYLDITDGGTNYQSMFSLFCKLRDTNAKVEYRVRNGLDTYRSSQTGLYGFIPFMTQIIK